MLATPSFTLLLFLYPFKATCNSMQYFFFKPKVKFKFNDFGINDTHTSKC